MSVPEIQTAGSEEASATTVSDLRLSIDEKYLSWPKIVLCVLGEGRHGLGCVSRGSAVDMVVRGFNETLARR